MLNAMSAISSVTASAASLVSGPAPGAPSTAAAPFADLLQDAVGSVNELQSQARVAVSDLLSGTGTDIHQAMIATEKASMSFELSLAVRNKAVQAYQQVMSMQF